MTLWWKNLSICALSYYWAPFFVLGHKHSSPYTNLKFSALKNGFTVEHAEWYPAPYTQTSPSNNCPSEDANSKNQYLWAAKSLWCSLLRILSNILAPLVCTWRRLECHSTVQSQSLRSAKEPHVCWKWGLMKTSEVMKLFVIVSTLASSRFIWSIIGRCDRYGRLWTSKPWFRSEGGRGRVKSWETSLWIEWC